MEKSALTSKHCWSGNWTRSGLCMRVKKRLASACTPYWSSVSLFLLSHMFLSGHQSAKSDQSLRIWPSCSTSWKMTPPMCMSPVTRSECSIISNSNTFTLSSQLTWGEFPLVIICPDKLSSLCFEANLNLGENNYLKIEFQFSLEKNQKTKIIRWFRREF